MTGRRPVRFRGVQGGLTLIELMVVVAVLAILATVAIPTYDRYTRGARRADGKAALTAIALAQERAFSVYQKYVSLPSLETLAGLDKEIAGGGSPKGKYDVAMTSLSAAFFRADATPKADDPDCATLYITSVGLKSVDGGSKGKDYCW